MIVGEPYPHAVSRCITIRIISIAAVDTTRQAQQPVTLIVIMIRVTRRFYTVPLERADIAHIVVGQLLPHRHAAACCQLQSVQLVVTVDGHPSRLRRRIAPVLLGDIAVVLLGVAGIQTVIAQHLNEVLSAGLFQPASLVVLIGYCVQKLACCSVLMQLFTLQLPDFIIAQLAFDVAAKMAEALGVTLDYLVKDGKYEQIDNEMLKRLKEVQGLEDEKRALILAPSMRLSKRQS